MISLRRLVQCNGGLDGGLYGEAAREDVENAASVETQDVVGVALGGNSLQLRLSVEPRRFNGLKRRIVSRDGLIEFLPAVGEHVSERD